MAIFFIENVHIVNRASLNITQSFLSSDKLEKREDGKRETEKAEINWWIKCEELSVIIVAKEIRIGCRS